MLCWNAEIIWKCPNKTFRGRGWAKTIWWNCPVSAANLPFSAKRNLSQHSSPSSAAELECQVSNPTPLGWGLNLRLVAKRCGPLEDSNLYMQPGHSRETKQQGIRLALPRVQIPIGVAALGFYTMWLEGERRKKSSVDAMWKDITTRSVALSLA